jgi:hypothetical protein
MIRRAPLSTARTLKLPLSSNEASLGAALAYSNENVGWGRGLFKSYRKSSWDSPDVELMKLKKFYASKKLVHSFEKSLSFRKSLKLEVKPTTASFPDTRQVCI